MEGGTILTMSQFTILTSRTPRIGLNMLCALTVTMFTQKDTFFVIVVDVIINITFIGS